eukprot:7211089-Ditylum_brightwellii.AAC.1
MPTNLSFCHLNAGKLVWGSRYSMACHSLKQNTLIPTMLPVSTLVEGCHFKPFLARWLRQSTAKCTA